tara:strand:- start:23797 stop:25431 length:1635 start_codon:yes stop_codon:yes gene_type:complete
MEKLRANRLDLSLIALIVRQFREFWYYYLGALLTLFATHWIQSTLPFYAKDLAEMVEKGSSSIETWPFILLAVGIIVFRTSSRLLFFYPARIQQKLLRVELLERLENTSPYRFEKRSAGQLFQVLNGDLEHIRALIGFALLQIGNIIISLAVLLPKLAAFESRLLIALLPMLCGSLIFTLFVVKSRKWFRQSQDRAGEVNHFLIESYVGKRTVKNYHAEKSFINMFSRTSWHELEASFRSGVNISIAMPLIPLGVGLSLIWGGWIIWQVDLGAPSLVLFSGFVFLFLEPLAFFSWIGAVFSSSSTAWDRLSELVHDLEKPSDFEMTEDGKVDFWGERIKIPFAESKWNVIVGATGCGKTHVLKQLAQQYKDQETRIAYVAQEPYLYNDTLEKNIFLGKDITSEMKDRALELLKLFALDFLETSPERLLALEVGENGKRLSGGQAKRLCLIRTLLSGADVLFWDDPFSSVDLIHERHILNALKSAPELKNKTLLMTSHRLSTVRQCDIVIALEKESGVKEFGIASELVAPEAKSWTYAYFEKQMV